MPAAKGTRPPNAGKGRKKGSANKATTLLKDSILQAAALSGYDQKGKDGLIGYLTRVANEDIKAFSSLLGRVLPLQVTDGDGNALKVPQSVTFVISKVPGADCKP